MIQAPWKKKSKEPEDAPVDFVPLRSRLELQLFGGLQILFLFLMLALFFLFSILLTIHYYHIYGTFSHEDTRKALIMSVLSLVVLGLNIVGVFMRKRTRKKRQKLTSSGMTLATCFLGVLENRRGSPERLVSRIFTEYIDPVTQEKTFFQSDWLRYNPAPYLERSQTLRVIVEPGRREYYLVDLDGVEQARQEENQVRKLQ